MADDEGFGDFNFVSAATFYQIPSTAAQPPPSTSADDDDWSDFVAVPAPPVKPPAFNGFAHSQAPADPFGFFNVSNGGEKVTKTSVGSDPSPIRVGKQWEKPKGALPLSLFGEEEERDEQAGQDLTGLTENKGFGRKGSNLNVSNDLMSNLSVENGSGRSTGLIGRSNGNGVDLSSNGWNGSSNSKLNGDFNDDEDDDGWEFKAAEPDKRVGNENSKGQGVVGVAELRAESSTFVNRGIQENNGGTGFSGGFGIPEFNNVHVASNGTSHGNGDWGFSFNFKPSPVTQDNSFFETYSKKKPNSDANVSDSYRADDNVWEFKDAPPKTGSEHKLEEAKVATLAGAGGPNDFFSAPDWVSHLSSGSNFAFPLIPNSGTKHRIISDSYSNGKKDDIATGLSCPPDNNHVESDDNFWEFQDAFSESGSKLEGESVVASNSPINITSSAINGENKVQQSEVTLNNHRQALPLSIFGDEELETDASTVRQDIPIHTVASHQINTASSLATNISITDLISSLYSQGDSNTKIHTSNENEITAPPVTTMLEPDVGDDADDDSWEFKDAVSEVQNPTSIANLEDSPQNTCTKIQLDDFLELYCKLKHESYFLALYHLDQKKKAQSSLSGEDATEALEEEIQKLYNDLPQDIMRSDQFQSGNPSPRNTCLNELHKALQELKFQVLESEYQLSQRLSLAEKDLTSAVELLRHAASILRILRLGSMEEQSRYIAVWSQMVSKCAEELKHGSLIWTESLDKNVQKEILSEPQGKRYIVALGEIYRVVLILRASTKLYRPWILLQSSECSSLFSLLNECSTIWSSSGLDEALRSISDKDDSKYDGHVNALLHSLTTINHLDIFSLQNHFLSGQQALCSLSLLTAAAVPGIKIVVWNDVHYLLTLANLWINLVGGEPPRLPHFTFS